MVFDEASRQRLVYPAKYDLVTYILVGISPAILLGLMVFYLWIGAYLATGIMIGSFLFVSLLLWCCLPQSYHLDEEDLVIRVGWPVRYKFAFGSILDVRSSDYGENACKCRVKFVTSFGDVVLIERDGWDLLISPQDPQQFIADMNRMVRQYNRGEV